MAVPARTRCRYTCSTATHSTGCRRSWWDSIARCTAPTRPDFRCTCCRRHRHWAGAARAAELPRRRIPPYSRTTTSTRCRRSLSVHMHRKYLQLRLEAWLWLDVGRKDIPPAGSKGLKLPWLFSSFRLVLLIVELDCWQAKQSLGESRLPDNRLNKALRFQQHLQRLTKVFFLNMRSENLSYETECRWSGGRGLFQTCLPMVARIF